MFVGAPEHARSSRIGLLAPGMRQEIVTCPTIAAGDGESLPAFDAADPTR
jgi:hypothetical protein